METQKNLREIRPFPCNPKSLNKQMLRRILAVSFTVVSLFIALCCLAAASMAAVRLFFLMSQNDLNSIPSFFQNIQTLYFSQQRIGFEIDRMNIPTSFHLHQPKGDAHLGISRSQKSHGI